MHMHVSHKSDPPWEPRGCVLLQWEPFFDVPHITPSNHAFGVCHPNLWAAQERHRHSPAHFLAHFLGKLFTNFFFLGGGWMNQQPAKTILLQEYLRGDAHHMFCYRGVRGLNWWIYWFMRGLLCLQLSKRSPGAEEVSLSEPCEGPVPLRWKRGRQSESGTVVVFWSVF